MFDCSIKCRGEDIDQTLLHGFFFSVHTAVVDYSAAVNNSE